MHQPAVWPAAGGSSFQLGHAGSSSSVLRISLLTRQALLDAGAGLLAEGRHHLVGGGAAGTAQAARRRLLQQAAGAAQAAGEVNAGEGHSHKGRERWWAGLQAGAPWERLGRGRCRANARAAGFQQTPDTAGAACGRVGRACKPPR